MKRTSWYKKFRAATYVNTAVWLVWTITILLPFAPFSSLQPIMAGGGAGTWFTLGYLLLLAVTVLGFAGISFLAFIIEEHEHRIINNGLMLVGFILLYAGSLSSTLLLGFAGAVGGYALVAQNSGVSNAQNLLSSFVGPITAASSLAVLGTAITLYSMATAKATKA